MFDRVLIANRGEIAARVARTCNKLGIHTIAVYSEADEGAPHTQIADEAHHIGPAPVLESYLDIPKIIEVAEETNADAIHPGYGLLSENPEFVEEVEAQEDLTFVGPRAEVMELMGDKADAREFAENAGVPVVPGSDGPVDDIEEAKEFADDVGYPVLVKAAAGGGGIGMNKADDEDELEKAFQASQRRGKSSFDDPTVYMEKYIENPRHLEIQILADQHGKTLHMFERECSVQRRHQKVIEETPSTLMSKVGGLREEMAEAAVQLADAAEYTNAGTVEFVADNEGNFYFIEMNTRLQVEHTVTEMITGEDIVEHQLRIADGEPLEFVQDDFKMHGHSIQCRIYAENPDKNFMPAPGEITNYSEPQGEGVRVDSGARENFEITRYYDPLVAKLVTHADTRSAAIDKMVDAINNYEIGGLTTNKEMHLDVLQSDEFQDGTVHTSWLEERY
jgi:acetyl-CoA carboxylase biotin carboxylase subunit